MQQALFHILENAVGVEVVQHQLVVLGQLETGNGEIGPQALRQARREVPAAAMMSDGETELLEAAEVVRAALVNARLVEIGAGTGDFQK